MKIWNCKVNHMINPVGFQLKQTTFSWISDCPDVDTSRIVVKVENEVAVDTGWKKLNPLATKLNIHPKPRTVYEWKVSVKDKAGEIITSETQFFETGKMDEPWKAKWIASQEGIDRHPIFFTRFPINSDKGIKRARLYICGLGLYEAYIDGNRIGDAYLTPGFYAYNLWNQVQTYDITKYLSEVDCEKELSVLIGDGWYKSRVSFESPDAGFYGTDYRLLAEVHIEYSDGTEEVTGTDENWKVRRSNITFSGIYDGEWQDDTLPKLPEEKIILTTPAKGTLSDNLSIPVKAHEEFHPVLVENEAGEILLDNEQNLAGIFELRVNVPYGQKVHLQFGEILQDGQFYRDNLRTAKAEFWYVSDGKEKMVRPHFTFYGFRYIKIEGIRDFDPRDIIVKTVYSDISMKGKIETGHKKLNRLISNVIWGMKSNFVDIPTDCPQRDERMGWTGDTQVFSETAYLFADTYPFYRKYLYDMAKEQSIRNGRVPDIIPAVGMGESGSSVWGDAATIIPWNLYMESGDISILEEQYESMKSWVEYIRDFDGDEHRWKDKFHYGDWLALDCPYEGNEQVRGGTDEGFIAEIYYRKSALILAKTAKLLGKEADAAKYQKLAEEIHREILKEYYSPNGRCCVNTQTAALLTIREGINDEERAKRQLLTLLEISENKLKTGFVGTPLLCQVLADVGCEKLADKILLNEEYPGWLYAVNLGATTIWERWNSVDETGHISSTGMNSLNHYSYGAIASYIWKSLAGIRPVEEYPGYQKAVIMPHINMQIGYLDAEYESAAGMYRIFWEVKDSHHIHLKVSVPAGGKAEVILPLDKEKRKLLLTAETLDITYETEVKIGVNRSIDDSLQVLIGNSECKRILREELPELDYLLGFTRPYALSETLHNLRYDRKKIKKIAERLQKVIE